MKKIQVLVLAFGLISGHVNSQGPIGCPAGAGNPCAVTPSCELVCNGSFEWVSGEPSGISQGPSDFTLAYNWVTPTGASPDFYSTNPGSAFVGIPCNFNGSQPASTNNCTVANHYAGILMRNFQAFTGPDDWTEYVQTRFSSQMVAGKNYIVSFYISKAENKTAQINGLGVYITNSAISSAGDSPMPNVPTIITQNIALLNNTNGWSRISFCYTALGGESYLTIGRPAGASYSLTPGPQVAIACGTFSPEQEADHSAYLYIDEVSVRLVDIDLGPPQTVTPCGTVALTGNFACGSPNDPTISYLWSGGPGTINNSTLQNTYASVNSNAVFSLAVNYQGSIGQGCSASSTMGVISNSSNVSIIFPALSCTNQSIFNMSNYVSPATQGTFSGLGVFLNNFNPTASLPSNVYNITFNYGPNGCASIPKVVFLPPKLTFSVAYNNNACSYKTFTAVPNCPVALQNYTFSWVFGDGAFCNSCSSVVSNNYIFNGNFTVSCNITGPGGYNQNISLPITVTNTGNNPNISVSSNGTGTVCPGNSTGLIASGGTSTYTWFPPGIPPDMNSFSITVTPSVTTTYTVVSTNSNGCVVHNTVTVYVDPLIPQFTVNVSPDFVCNGNNNSLITVAPFGTYTVSGPAPILPFGGNTYVVSPTVTSSYTVSGFNTHGCLTKSVVTIGVVPCECLAATGTTISGTISQDLAPSTAYKFVNNVTIVNNVTFFKDDIVLYPDVKITVSPGATLNILGSHLHGCGDLWNSIQVLNNTVNGQYGVINITPGGKGIPWTPFIEDAKVAVDVQNWSIPGTNAANILTADEVTFNHNLISIRLNGYGQNQNNYPFVIQNSLFTSRNIPFSLLNWPKTATVKNSTNVGGNVMQTPYINNSSYLPSGITFTNSVFFGQFPTNGIVLTNIGVTTVSVFPTYREISIGQNGPPNFNCFDNLQEDITANNSNLTVVNSVFQNGRQGGKGGIQFGKAIVATSTNSSDGFSNNRIRIMAGNNQGNFNCRFYEKVACADITGYLDNQVLFTESYSNANDYSTFNNNALPGNRGFNIRTNRFVNIILQNNKLYNIRNSMLVSLFDGFYSVGNQQGFTRYVGLIEVQNNLVDRYVGTPPGGLKPFVNIGLSIADVINSNATGFSPGPVFVDASANTFTNVHNGIDTRNFAYCSVGITSNTIGLLNEPSLNPQNIQNGIQAISNLKIIGVNANSITGPLNYAPNTKGISTWNNLMLSVRCNTTAETDRGVEFNRAQIVAAFEDNVMKDHRFGLVLDNAAVLTGTNNLTLIGAINRPTDNFWVLPWPLNKFKSLTLNSSAQNGRLYIQPSNANLNPENASINIGGFQNCPTPDQYTTGCQAPTLYSVNLTESPTCRLVNNNNNGGGNNAAAAMMEQMVTSSFNYSNNVNEMQFQDKTFSYRGLKSSPALMNGSNILTSFYGVSQNNSMQAFCGMENDIMNKNFNAAQSQISAFTATNNIESNYKNYYQVLLNAMDSTYNSNDSLTLWSIANLCPLTDGAVVFQAQATYNSLYNGYYKFNGNCGGNNNVRLINPVASAVENLTEKTVFKTELFPNPNDGNFAIRLRTSVEKQGAEIRIFDITGRELYKENRIIETGEELKMTNNLLNGTYFVKIKFEDGSADTHRLIISK